MAIFIDTNIPIYAGGGEHPLKEPSLEVLALIARRPGAFATDAEVLQELLHRYVALGRWSQGREVFQRFAALMAQRVEAIHAVDIETAATLADQHSGLAARDLVHVAVMARIGSAQIVSADRGFDRLAELERLDPANVGAWRIAVEA